MSIPLGTVSQMTKGFGGWHIDALTKPVEFYDIVF